MKCSKCSKEFEEKELQLSHDVPTYMFPGPDRKTRSQMADKYPRRYLCIKCHDIYERILFSVIFNALPLNFQLSSRQKAIGFSRSYFKEVDKDDTKET